jgi:hypothetical protein
MNDRAGTTTQTISVDDQSPHYVNILAGTSFLYLMRLPLSLQQSRSFTMMFA